MEIYSFTGKSGTGKSYSAARICREKHIDAIIDDGLLIYRGGIAAGRSAKECSSKAAAMRTALFNYDDHREEVRKKLLELNPDKLMVMPWNFRRRITACTSKILRRKNSERWQENIGCRAESMPFRYRWVN